MKRGKIDVVVGMQYGDEGKGAVCGMLHILNRYTFSCRVGGSQAEHRFRHGDKQFRIRVLPSISCLDPKVTAFLGAGHIIRDDILQREVCDYGLKWRNIHIDDQASVVANSTKACAQSDALFKKRGGYGMGISGTLSEKIRRDGSECLARENTKTSGRVNKWIGDLLDAGQNGLLEGSQGALLSLDHGFYPHTTSYNVNTPSLIGSAGLSMKDIGLVYGVFRCYPMRVAGESGPMLGAEETYENIEEKMGIKVDNYRKYQTNEDNSSFGKERITDMSPEETIMAIRLNTPDRVVLTHTDWCTKEEVAERVAMIRECATIVGHPVEMYALRYGERLLDYNLLP